MSDQIEIHIDPSDKRDGLPDCGDGKSCERKDCPGPRGWQSGFGLAGGGYGVYSYCDICERIVEKTVTPDDM